MNRSYDFEALENIPPYIQAQKSFSKALWEAISDCWIALDFPVVYASPEGLVVYASHPNKAKKIRWATDIPNGTCLWVDCDEREEIFQYSIVTINEGFKRIPIFRFRIQEGEYDPRWPVPNSHDLAGTPHRREVILRTALMELLAHWGEYATTSSELTTETWSNAAILFSIIMEVASNTNNRSFYSLVQETGGEALYSSAHGNFSRRIVFFNDVTKETIYLTIMTQKPAKA